MTSLGMFCLMGSAIATFGGIWALTSGKIASRWPGQEITKDDNPRLYQIYIEIYFTVAGICAAVFILTFVL